MTVVAERYRARDRRLADYLPLDGQVLVGSRGGSRESRIWTMIGAMGWLIAVAGLRIVQSAIRRDSVGDAVVDSAVWFVVGFPLALWIAHQMNPPYVPPPDSECLS